MFERMRASVVLVLSLLLLTLSLSSHAAVITVPGDYVTVQEAVDAAAPGDTVDVAAGSYEEQVVIAKDLLLRGAGAGSTVLLSPVSLTAFFNSGSDDNYPVLYIHDATVQVAGLTIDGAGRGNGNSRFMGVAFWNAGGSVAAAAITGVRETPFSGAQHGLGLYAGNDSGGPYSLTLSDLTVDDYQKNGVTLTGAGLGVALSNVSCAGAGVTNVIAQNGIEIADGAGGTLTGCSVSGHHWDGASWTSTGLLLVAAAPTTVTGLDASEDQVCVYAYDSDLSLDASTILHTGADPAYDGITAWNSTEFSKRGGPRVQPSPLSALTPAGGRALMTVAVTNSTITGQNRPGAWGVDAYVEEDALDLDVHGCTITGFETGCWLEEAGGALDADCTDNRISGNDVGGMWSNATSPVDARQVWWGSHLGPYHAANNPDGLGDAVEGNVLFTPWLGMGTLGPLPASSGPINCSGSVTLAFHYAPDADTPALRGYEITVDSDFRLGFGEADIVEGGALASVGDPTFFDIVDNLDGTFTVSGAILGATGGLTDPGDLFSVTFHGQATGQGVVTIPHYKLRDLMNADIYATLADATVDVDCTPPDVPALFAEPGYTQGTENTLDWSDQSASGAVEYLVQRATDAGFGTGLADSGWIPGLSFTFTGLADAQLYHYRVRTRDALANESNWSAAESSTQDDTKPVSSAGPLSTYQGALSFNVPYTASDATSGLAQVELFVDVDGGGYASAGVYTASPIAFTAGGDGVYSFYTVAADNVGNVEDTPGGADTSTTVDTTAPAGTFVINSGLAFTNNLAVNLNNAITDAHPPLEMRFSNDDVTYSAWEPYQSSKAWTLAAGGDGPRVVYAQFRDVVGNVFPTQDQIVYDATAPGPAAGLSVLRGHQQVELTWTDPGDGDLEGVEIYRGMWHDAANASAYPEYDDLPDDVLPTRPASRAAAVASPEWVLAGSVSAGVGTFVDAWAPRGYYYYEVFPRDAAFNFGPPLAQNAGPVANYWLGDIADAGTGDGFYDGLVNLTDITVMGASFGVCEGDGAYNNEADIGPTDSGLPDGIPVTDSCVDFEDLILFAINYGQVAPLSAPPALAETVQLSWYRLDDGIWGLGLLAPNHALKGIRLSAALPDGVVPRIEAGAALAAQGPSFFANIDANGIDVSLVILGTDRAFAADGELLRVILPAGVEPGAVSIDARSLANTPLELALDDEVIPDLPQSYRLGQNFPNPFNPKTRIDFDLPSPQPTRVAIFGADGRLVQVLLDRDMPAGYHSVIWDGRDANGGQVASGVYFFRVQAGPLDETRKMLLLK